MKKIIIDVFCLLSVVVISCNSSPIDRIEKELSTKNNDSVVREVPIRILEPGIIRKIQYDKVRTVGLPSLENGFTKFQLRIWEDLEHLTGRIIILKYTNDQWTAELCKYKYESTGSYFPDSLSGQIFPLKKPKSGWNKFLNKLLNLQILTLPDFDSIHD